MRKMIVLSNTQKLRLKWDEKLEELITKVHKRSNKPVYGSQMNQSKRQLGPFSINNKIPQQVTTSGG